MNERLDYLVKLLATAPSEHSLENFEARVRREIGRRRAETRIVSALVPVRVASIGLALTVGVMMGAIAAARSPDSVLVGANLEPSTLLEGWR